MNKIVDQVSGKENRIRTIFLTVLNRVPDEEEMSFCLELADEASDEREYYRNLIAGLISSQEFYFIF